jgi:hypothetical protein
VWSLNSLWLQVPFGTIVTDERCSQVFEALNGVCYSKSGLDAYDWEAWWLRTYMYAVCLSECACECGKLLQGP